MAIFVEKGAPDPATLAECDQPLRLLREKTSDVSEWLEAARELVRNEPVAMHWCFYGKLYGLEARLKSLSFLDERQNWIIREFQTLTPLARAFQKEYQDTRYLRWAVNRYRSLSEWVFYRKLELSVDGIAALGPQALNPWGKVRPPRERIPGSILERYGILQSPGVPTSTPGAEWALLPAAPAGGGRSPASEPSPLPEATPVAVASPLPEPSPLPEATPAAAALAPAAETTTAPAPAAAFAPELVPTVPLPLEAVAESPEPASRQPASAAERAPASQAETTPAPAVVEAVAPAPADLGPAEPIEQISLPQ